MGMRDGGWGMGDGGWGMGDGGWGDWEKVGSGRQSPIQPGRENIKCAKTSATDCSSYSYL